MPKLRPRFLASGPATLMLLAFAGGTAGARHIMWRPTDRPPVSLQQALALAEAELKKERSVYYCIGATLARTYSEGDWELRFATRDGKSMWVSVGSDRKLRKSPLGFEKF